ncbi:trans-sulfuration enzyme family protein [Rothia nasimurium]|uniref:trans-sulfuration enzyme family protein n=1 Tax=Rothia nasimurium TaxID=85336 RepID=UPI001F34F962|nr:PLP-dependent aspartate aminotransferase family protein [Rothia nasimurium]
MAGFTTRAIHAVHSNEEQAVVPPIYTASTFGQPTDGTEGPFEYQRGGNPTRSKAETTLAAIEGAEHAFLYASGMGATAAAMGILEHGQTLLMGMPVYGGNYRFATIELPKRGVAHELVYDLTTLSDAHFEGKNVGMVFIETPSNPTLRVTDIKKVAELAHRHGALLVVDNTVMTPYLQKPLELGADIVVQSATKYLAGHGDLLAGVATTNNAELADKLFKAQLISGGVLSPIDSYRLLQNVKTLALRMERQQANADVLIEAVAAHPAVDTVYFPGSYSAEEAKIQAEQATGKGALFSFTVKEGYDIKAFLDALQVFTFAVSLGGIESLVCLPTTMTQGAYSQEDRDDAGLTTRLVRVAVGIEDVDDLRADIIGALDAA